MRSDVRPGGEPAAASAPLERTLALRKRAAELFLDPQPASWVIGRSLCSRHRALHHVDPTHLRPAHETEDKAVTLEYLVLSSFLTKSPADRSNLLAALPPSNALGDYADAVELTVGLGDGRARGSGIVVAVYQSLERITSGCGLRWILEYLPLAFPDGCSDDQLVDAYVSFLTSLLGQEYDCEVRSKIRNLIALLQFRAGKHLAALASLQADSLSQLSAFRAAVHHANSAAVLCAMRSRSHGREEMKSALHRAVESESLGPLWFHARRAVELFGEDREMVDALERCVPTAATDSGYYELRQYCLYARTVQGHIFSSKYVSHLMEESHRMLSLHDLGDDLLSTTEVDPHG